MVSEVFLYELLRAGLLWLYVMLAWAWPFARVLPALRSPPPTPPRRQRSGDPKPFPGLLHKPPCAACEQATQDPVSSPLPAPPPPLTSHRGCPRQVDASTQFCPHAHCAYYGRVGYGNLQANGLPTICQPQFVSFLPHLHDWLTTNAACVIAGAMTQHGHKHTQQSVANIA
jgi:hypothetical protein